MLLALPIDPAFSKLESGTKNPLLYERRTFEESANSEDDRKKSTFVPQGIDAEILSANIPGDRRVNDPFACISCRDGKLSRVRLRG